MTFPDEIAPRSFRLARRGEHGAFTLVELLVSMAVLAILMLLITQVIGQVQKTWLQSNTRTAQFREARMAFDLITRNLAQATLSPYWDTDAGGLSDDPDRQKAVPTKYQRKADLQFICGPSVPSTGGPSLVMSAPSGGADSSHLPYDAVFFQATLGVTQTADYEKLQNLLCGRGYFVQYGNDDAFRPPFVTRATNRFRLMEFSPTAEQNEIYFDQQPQNSGSGPWFKKAGDTTYTRTSESNSNTSSSTSLARGYTRPVAENIIALIIAPRVSDKQALASNKDPHWIAPHYFYDSTKVANNTTTSPQGTQNLLPPMVDVVMVAIDEATQDKFSPSEAGDLQNQAPFSDATKLNLGTVAMNSTDIYPLTQYLLTKKINFRVFAATVEIRGARWSF